MLGRFALHDDRTLFLFVFAADVDPLPAMLDLPAQKAMLRESFGEGKWECARILAELDRTQDLYFDRVSQIRIESWSRGRVALVGDAAFCVSLMAGQGSALAMTSAYVLAGELAKASGQHEVAFGKYEELLRAYIEIETEGSRALCRRLRAKDPMGPVPSQSSDKGVCNPGAGKTCVRQGSHRHAATARLSVATLASTGN